MANAPITQASEAAQRYATALFELAQDKGQLSETHRSFAEFVALVRENEDLARLVASPAFTRDDKKAALLAIADGAGVSPLVKNLLGVMAENGRSRDILGAQVAFDTLYANQRGVKRAVARTAKPMSADQRARLEGILAKAVGGEVELSEEVDESLIGGVQLQIGSTLVDASLAAKLDRMNSAMKGA
ncbi:MAG: ATP synthase F1 subunit delta [Hyphomonadaceae bacterium]|nr:ATP synthase F1 subunit delta [Hyphomonadaceae bacterium]